VNDPVKLFGRKQVGHAGPVAHVELDEPEFWVRQQPVEPALLERHRIIIVQVVQPHHLVAACQQFECSRHADETGGTCQ
jgi:hypothetical protein